MKHYKNSDYALNKFSEGIVYRFADDIVEVTLALDKLTDVQRKRYLLYYVEELTIRQIADIEGVGHSKIQKRIEGAQKKIKKVLAST